MEDFLALEKEYPNFHFHLALDRPDPKADALGVPWFILGSSLVFNPRGIGKVQGKENLNKSTFFGKVPEYHSGAINKEKTSARQMLRPMGAEMFG